MSDRTHAGRLGVLAALVAKDLRLLSRDRIALFFALVFPLLFGVLFGAVFSGTSDAEGPPRIAVVLVDLDQTEDSAALIGLLRQRERIEFHDAETAEHAHELVNDGAADAYVLIAPGFGERARMPFAGEPMRVEVGSGPTGRPARGILGGVVTEAAFRLLGENLADPERASGMIESGRRQIEAAEGMDAGQKLAFRALMNAADAAVRSQGGGETDADGGIAFQPVEIAQNEIIGGKGDGEISAFAISFPQAVLWGVMGCTAGFGLSLVSERTRGTMTRLRVAPIGRWHIVLGKAVACLMATIAVSVALLVVAAVVFGVRPHAPATLAIAVVSVALCFVGVMMLLAALGTSEASGSALSWGVLLTMAMIGGGAIPLTFMPGWLREIGHVSPVKWGILAIEGGLWRDFSPAAMALPIGMLLGIGALCFAAGAAIFARREAH
ncbi:MAG: ABC transporter permease [Planctomycetota bacterium]